MNIKLVSLPAGFGVDAIKVAETPITEGQWISVMGGDIKRGPNYPKVNVSWNDAMEFCAKLSEMTGVEYRLPTDAEFCRVLGVEPSEDHLAEYAVFDTPEIVPVRTKLPNEYGIYDLRGLVWEWLGDDLRVGDDLRDGRRLLRGGSWASNHFNARAVYRHDSHPGDRNNVVGFRVVGKVQC